MASIYCFKNGYSLFRETHAVASGSTEFFISKLPAEKPTHGSLWFETEGGGEVLRALSATQKQVVKRESRTLIELLAANVDHQVELLVEDTWVPRRLKSVQGQLLVVESEEGGVEAIPLSDVSRVRGKKLQLQYDERVECHGVVVDLEPGAERLSVMLVTDGVSFAPSYKIRFCESALLELTSHACLMNDALDTELFAEVNCLAGVPNLQFQEILDPMAQVQSCQQFLQALSSEGSGGRSIGRRGGALSQTMTNNYIHIAAASPQGPTASKSESNADDLHVYSFKDVVCPKGSRAYMELFPKADNVPFSDVYEAKVHLDDRCRDTQHIDVHHSIRFKNSTGVPFTTGPCLITRGQQQSLVCQTQINFTPDGTNALVKLTKTLAVLCVTNEAQRRTNEVKEYKTSTYTKMAASGSINLINNKGVAVKISLTVDIVGVTSFLTKDTQPKSQKVTTSSYAPYDEHTKCVFEISIEPHSEVELKYARKFFRK